MGTRGSHLSRTLDYFRTGNLDEVEFVFSRAGQIIKSRTTSPQEVNKPPAPTPIKRKRRTKEQIAAEKAKVNGQTTIAEGAVAAGAPGEITI